MINDKIARLVSTANKTRQEFEAILSLIEFCTSSSVHIAYVCRNVPENEVTLPTRMTALALRLCGLTVPSSPTPVHQHNRSFAQLDQLDPFANNHPSTFQPWLRLHPRAPRRLPRHPRRPSAARGRSAPRATALTSTRSSSRSTPIPVSPRRVCPS